MIIDFTSLFSDFLKKEKIAFACLIYWNDFESGKSFFVIEKFPVVYKHVTRSDIFGY
jgi:hypothetical protein